MRVKLGCGNIYAFLFLHFLKDDGHENNDIYLEIYICLRMALQKVSQLILILRSAIRYKGRKTSIINTTFELFFRKRK